jgi:hypothetical protein
MNDTPPVEGDLRVWWIPQVPMKPFLVNVDSLKTARKLLDTLAAYDLFQYENNVRPDYANTGGLEVFEDGDWVDWESADGDSIDDLDPETLI